MNFKNRTQDFQENSTCEGHFKVGPYIPSGIGIYSTISGS